MENPDEAGATYRREWVPNFDTRENPYIKYMLNELSRLMQR